MIKKIKKICDIGLATGKFNNESIKQTEIIDNMIMSKNVSSTSPVSRLGNNLAGVEDL